MVSLPTLLLHWLLCKIAMDWGRAMGLCQPLPAPPRAPPPVQPVVTQRLCPDLPQLLSEPKELGPEPPPLVPTTIWAQVNLCPKSWCWVWTRN